MIQFLLIASIIAGGAFVAMGVWTGAVLMVVFAAICAQGLLVQRRKQGYG